MADSPRTGLAPRSLAPFFVLAALFHLGCIATRFDALAARLPPGVAAGLLFATFPLLFVEGYFESRLDYGDSVEGLPLWMQIDSRPVKAAFTFAFTYLSIVLLQTFDLAIGPVDPTPPESFPPATRALWFAGFSVGMCFPNYLATTSMLVPPLRAIGRLGQKLTAPVAVVVIAALGAALGYGVLFVLHSQTVSDEIAAAESAWVAFVSNPAVAIGVVFAGLVLPALLGLLLERLRGGDRPSGVDGA